MLGGTWRLLRGVFLYGAEADSAITSNVLDGGEKAHQLSVYELPSHNHTTYHDYWTVSTGSGTQRQCVNTYVYGDSYTNLSMPTTHTGSNYAHNNMPPYKNINIWERTA